MAEERTEMASGRATSVRRQPKTARRRPSMHSRRSKRPPRRPPKGKNQLFPTEKRTLLGYCSGLRPVPLVRVS
eukprot:1579147-Pyramimonas_sp.AAC.1